MDMDLLKTVALYSALAAIIVIIIFIFIARKIMISKMKKGDMIGVQLIECTAGLVMNQFRKEKKIFKLTIDSLKSIDDEIDRMLISNKPADILTNTDTVFMFGCYLGTILKHSIGAKWIKDDGEYPRFMKLKNGEIILPFERVMKRIMAGKEDSIYDYGLIIKTK
jgi:hypothetical protein